MKGPSILASLIGFVGGIAAIPIISAALAQPAAPAHIATQSALGHGSTAVQTKALVVQAAAADSPGRILDIPNRSSTSMSKNTSRSTLGGYFSTTPATFMGIRDNGCRFYVTTSAAAAQSWTGPDDPRSQPCTPTANSFSPVWSHRPTQAQYGAWIQVLNKWASSYPTITIQQADPIARAALAQVTN